MDGSEALTAIERALSGFSPQRNEFLGRHTVLARTSKFSILWAATRLHTFFVVTDLTGSRPSLESLDDLLDEAGSYARAHKGGLPRGLQTGVAVITVALVDHSDPVSAAWASKVHGRKFASLPFPVVADLATRTVVCPRRMLIGGLYARYLRRQVETYVRTPLND